MMNKKNISHTTLRGRMIFHIGLMVVCSLLIGVGAVVGINGLHQDMGIAVQGYRQLQQVYEIGFQVATAKAAISAELPDVPKALVAMETAKLKIGSSIYGSFPDSPPLWLDESKRNECNSLLDHAILQLKSSNPIDGSARERQMSAVNDVLGELAKLSTEIRTTIDAKQRTANSRRHLTLGFIVALAAAIVVIAVLAGARLYLSVVKPLDRLGGGVRRFAGGVLSERIVPEGDREFAALADDFNWMADELAGLYRDLEQKVEAKSKQLVRSERLASVGYLAAGVAHEINNPLGIITGYGERLLELLDRGMDETLLDRTRKSMKIVCEEAFRCKGITDRLLSLARPGSVERRPVSLRAIAGEVIRNIGGLPEYANRRITFDADHKSDDNVIGLDGEIKQVIVNLLLNALDAVQPNVGLVEVEIICRDDVQLTVADNGLGMTAQTLDQIFEPFYTEKSGDRPGIGLGLSITHAIMASHGGSITAESDGPGRGSRFTIRLPALRKGAELASN